MKIDYEVLPRAFCVVYMSTSDYYLFLFLYSQQLQFQDTESFLKNSPNKTGIARLRQNQAMFLNGHMGQRKYFDAKIIRIHVYIRVYIIFCQTNSRNV